MAYAFSLNQPRLEVAFFVGAFVSRLDNIVHYLRGCAIGCGCDCITDIFANNYYMFTLNRLFKYRRYRCHLFAYYGIEHFLYVHVYPLVCVYCIGGGLDNFNGSRSCSRSCSRSSSRSSSSSRSCSCSRSSSRSCSSSCSCSSSSSRSSSSGVSCL
jgi:hypothetical protein